MEPKETRVILTFCVENDIVDLVIFSQTNYNLFRQFVAVYTTKNMAKAAELLLLTPSAITRSIKSLEKELNLTLFIPQHRGVVATRQADELYARICSAFAILDNAENVAKDLDEYAGTIRVGCPTHVAESTLYPYFEEFLEKYPQIKIELNGKPKNETRDMLEKYTLDVMINISPFTNINQNFNLIQLKELTSVFFATETFLKNNKLTKKVTREQLAELPLIMPFKSHSIIRVLTDRLRIEVNPIIETVTAVGFMYKLVKNHKAVGFIIEDYLESCCSDDIVKLDIGEELPKASLGVMYDSRYINKATQLFVKGLIEFCKKS